MLLTISGLTTKILAQRAALRQIKDYHQSVQAEQVWEYIHFNFTEKKAEEIEKRMKEEGPTAKVEVLITNLLMLTEQGWWDGLMKGLQKHTSTADIASTMKSYLDMAESGKSF